MIVKASDVKLGDVILGIRHCDFIVDRIDETQEGLTFFCESATVRYTPKGELSISRQYAKPENEQIAELKGELSRVKGEHYAVVCRRDEIAEQARRDIQVKDGEIAELSRQLAELDGRTTHLSLREDELLRKLADRESLLNVAAAKFADAITAGACKIAMAEPVEVVLPQKITVGGHFLKLLVLDPAKVEAALTKAGLKYRYE